jgi:hypothetical protein
MYAGVDQLQHVLVLRAVHHVQAPAATGAVTRRLMFRSVRTTTLSSNNVSDLRVKRWHEEHTQ